MSVIGDSYKKLRMLDMDDLILLNHLLEGGRPSTGAALLGLTPPAVSHRLRKIEQVYGIKLFERVGTKVGLNEEAKILSKKASQALTLMAN
ncbi:MAG: LysR family transcriptional regulator [Oligoflexales bacterium]